MRLCTVSLFALILLAFPSCQNPQSGADPVVIQPEVPTHVVRFQGNGSSDSMPSQSIKSGSSAKLNVSTFTRSGYLFAGWASTATGAVAYADAALYTMGDSDIDLYARWGHLVAFDANGGTGSIPAQCIACDASVTLSANTFTRSGYVFSGWATQPSGAVAYADKASYAMGSESTIAVDSIFRLYAVWTINESGTVSFNANGGSGTMDDQYITRGLSAPLSANTFSRTGYSFTGWASSSSGAVAYADGASYAMESGNPVLYAIWAINTYKIHFNANGGSGSMPDQSVVYGVQVSLNANTFTHASLAFYGWDSEDDLSHYYGGDHFTMGASDVTLNAQWGTAGLEHDTWSGGGGIAVKAAMTANGPSVSSPAVVVPRYLGSQRVVAVADAAFQGCAALQSIQLPDTVVYIGNSAFAGTPLTAIVLPPGLKTIGTAVFQDCVNLAGVTVPEGVTSLGALAFSGCSSLTAVSLPDTLTGIPYGAFYRTALGSIAIPDSVTSIGASAFSGCESLTSIAIPAKVTSIGPDVFSNCTALTSVTVKALTPPVLTGALYTEGPSLTAIRVPSGSVEAYKAADYWKYYVSIIIADNQ